MRVFKPDMAKKLRVSIRQLERLVILGKIPAPDGITRPGGSYWLLTTELNKIIDNQRRPER
jgi:hypothetical protein